MHCILARCRRQALSSRSRALSTSADYAATVVVASGCMFYCVVFQSPPLDLQPLHDAATFGCGQFPVKPSAT